MPEQAVLIGFGAAALIMIILLIVTTRRCRGLSRDLAAQKEILRETRQELSKLKALPTREEIYPLLEAYISRLEEGSAGT